ncbi:hypothetical protein OC844_005138 [Tilletia horrida]|nr:hypothetical protein OC844_005138 [Tilletia horrida]
MSGSRRMLIPMDEAADIPPRPELARPSPIASRNGSAVAPHTPSQPRAVPDLSAGVAAPRPGQDGQGEGGAGTDAANAPCSSASIIQQQPSSLQSSSGFGHFTSSLPRSRSIGAIPVVEIPAAPSPRGSEAGAAAASPRVTTAPAPAPTVQASPGAPTAPASLAALPATSSAGHFEGMDDDEDDEDRIQPVQRNRTTARSRSGPMVILDIEDEEEMRRPPQPPSPSRSSPPPVPVETVAKRPEKQKKKQAEEDWEPEPDPELQPEQAYYVSDGDDDYEDSAAARKKAQQAKKRKKAAASKEKDKGKEDAEPKAKRTKNAASTSASAAGGDGAQGAEDAAAAPTKSKRGRKSKATLAAEAQARAEAEAAAQRADSADKDAPSGSMSSPIVIDDLTQRPLEAEKEEETPATTARKAAPGRKESMSGKAASAKEKTPNKDAAQMPAPATVAAAREEQSPEPLAERSNRAEAPDKLRSTASSSSSRSAPSNSIKSAAPPTDSKTSSFWGKPLSRILGTGATRRPGLSRRVQIPTLHATRKSPPPPKPALPPPKKVKKTRSEWSDDGSAAEEEAARKRELGEASEDEDEGVGGRAGAGFNHEMSGGEEVREGFEEEVEAY